MVTGLVDSVSYLKLGHVSVANTTGVVFLVGALAGGRISVRQAHRRARHLAIASVVQLVLVGALLVFNVNVTAGFALAVMLLGLNGIAAYRVSSSSAGWTAANPTDTTAEHRSTAAAPTRWMPVSQPQIDADVRVMDQIEALRPDLLRIREIYMSVWTMCEDDAPLGGAELAA